MLNREYKTSDDDKFELATDLSRRLAEILQDIEIFLKQKNKEITQDSLFSINYDFNFIKKYLAGYVENNKELFRKRLKPKGSVFIILSYNEPFILSIVPILNALVAGNDVIVKPSGRCIDFLKKIWYKSGLIDELKLSVKIIEKPSESDIMTTIKYVDCVYFFGSLKTAKKIYQICADLFVEFVPEIETADCKVFKFNNPTDDFLGQDCESTLSQSFTHTGQTCHRISGVFVHKDSFTAYKEKIMMEFNKLTKKGMNKLVAEDFVISEVYQQKLLEDISMSDPLEIIESENHLPKIVIEPDASSEFVKNAYFYPVLWLIPFSNLDQLCIHLNRRKFYLGFNIQSDDKLFIDSLIKKTRFTRYTVNALHTDVILKEGWGGRWPSGSGGYKSWIEHFSVSYKVLTPKISTTP